MSLTHSWNRERANGAELYKWGREEDEVYHIEHITEGFTGVWIL